MKSYIIITTLLLATSLANARLCYVCGEGSNDPFQDSEISPQLPTVSCDEFEMKKTDKDKYLIDCPVEYDGCITQIDGANIMRTCERLALNDCQTANNIIYCYCNLDYCNNMNASVIRENQQIERLNKWKFLGPESEDDEDSTESSGMNDIFQQRDVTRQHQNVRTDKPQDHNNLVTSNASTNYKFIAFELIVQIEIWKLFFGR